MQSQVKQSWAERSANFPSLVVIDAGTVKPADVVVEYSFYGAAVGRKKSSMFVAANVAMLAATAANKEVMNKKDYHGIPRSLGERALVLVCEATVLRGDDDG